MIRTAKPQHLPAINELANTYGHKSLEPRTINHRDIALVAEVDRRVIGFIWMGLMAGNTRGYIDHFMIDRAYSKQGVGFKLARTLYERAKRAGVRQIFGVIPHNDFHDKSAMNALKMAMVAHSEPYTLVYADLNHITSELRSTYGWR